MVPHITTATATIKNILRKFLFLIYFLFDILWRLHCISVSFCIAACVAEQQEAMHDEISDELQLEAAH